MCIRDSFQTSERLLQFPVAGSGCSHDERAVGHGFGHALELFRAREKRRGSHSGTRFAKRHFVGIHHAQAEKAEIAHDASNRADVERVASAHEDDAQAVEFGWSKQGGLFYASSAGPHRRQIILLARTLIPWSIKVSVRTK